MPSIDLLPIVKLLLLEVLVNYFGTSTKPVGFIVLRP